MHAIDVPIRRDSDNPQSRENHARMCEARQRFIQAFVAWVGHEPSLTDITEEVDGTASALTQIVALQWGKPA